MTFVIRPFSAESEGFEPPDPLRSTVFKTAAFDHSANSPKYVSRNGIAKVQRIFKPANFYSTFCKKSAIFRRFSRREQKTCTETAASKLHRMSRMRLRS